MPIAEDVVGDYLVMRFDYDIRKRPQNLMNSAITLNPNNEKKICVAQMTTGQNIFIVKTTGEDVSLYVKQRKGQDKKLELIREEEGTKYYALDYVGNGDVKIYAHNNSDNDVKLEQCTNIQGKFARKIGEGNIDNKSIYIDEKSEFLITITGKDVKGSDINVMQEGHVVKGKKISDGNQKVVYSVQLDKGEISVTYSGAKDDSVYIETPYEVR